MATMISSPEAPHLLDPIDHIGRAARLLRIACQLLDQGQVRRVRNGLDKLADQLAEVVVEAEAEAHEADQTFMADLATLGDLGYPLHEVLQPVTVDELRNVAAGPAALAKP
jgi:hypothetical protein